MHPLIYIGKSAGKGKGVFTSGDIDADTTIEISPVIVMSREERVLLDNTLLHDYIFEWGNEKAQCCMALGYLAMYNHSPQSNCEYEMNFDREEIRIKTVHPVKAGEELFVNYNGDWDDDKPVWFEAK